MSLLDKIDIGYYTYDLPDESIAKYPLKDRSDSKILIYDRGISETVFSNLSEYISAGSRIFFNNTKVIHARLQFHKESGARIEIFCLSPIKPVEYQFAFSETKSCQWKCMVGNLKKWKKEELNISFKKNGHEFTLNAKKLDIDDNSPIIEFSWSGGISFGEIMDELGQIPIPPYLNRKSESLDTTRYQTVYSQHKGSVAAPTAGLHFTQEILEELQQKNISLHAVSLHVGAGTFQPIKVSDARDHDMHSEVFSVSAETIKELADIPKTTIAIGTTSMRTLESLYWLGVKSLVKNELCTKLDQWENERLPDIYSNQKVFSVLYELIRNQKLSELTAETAIMIVPGYKFRVVDGLITNYHQPNSTLILLVAAFIGEAWKKVYQYALNNNFRFLSYGDSSLLWR